MHLSTDPGSVCDSPIASGPSESVHTTAGKRGLKRATKTRTGPKDGMSQFNFVNSNCTQGQSAVIFLQTLVLSVTLLLPVDLQSLCTLLLAREG